MGRRAGPPWRGLGPAVLLATALVAAGMNGPVPQSPRRAATAAYASSALGPSDTALVPPARARTAAWQRVGAPALLAPWPGDGSAGPAARTDPPEPPAWTPPTPLPPAPAADSTAPVAVVLSPHPDDETLSFGTWIANASASGHRVIVVSLTDGRSTRAIGAVSARLGRRVTRDEIAGSRVRELRAASSLLGVAPEDVYLAGLDDAHSVRGTRVTVEEAAEVVRAFAQRFPGATFATMSWIAERHPDHLNSGLALREALLAGTVTDATFAVSRLWWALPGPPAADVLPASGEVRRRVLAAAAAYTLWDPGHQRLSVGQLSVPGQFAALRVDPRCRFHGPALPSLPRS